jgi:SAM-dependent methyltransferase
MALHNERLREVVRLLLGRPGHEKVRTLVYELLVHGLGIPDEDVSFELALPEVRGRTDALLGRTIFEFKRDLRSELPAAEEELGRYLSDREKTGDRFVGIATDGAVFMPYKMRGDALTALTPFKPKRDKPYQLLEWLEAAVAVLPELIPDPRIVRRELGKQSLAYEVAGSQLEVLWADVKDHPDVDVKRRLWASLLEMVYGSSVDQDDLFFQHTYLTVVAKTMATRVLGAEVLDPEDLLSGKAFEDAGISGAVESDFFDWVLAATGGDELVRRIAVQVSRFRLEDVKQDVLKGLYESLIDPEQRFYLGEYYTPDWLAARMCDEAIDDPLSQRVLDPACGSGTFLFHSIRRFLAAAEAAGFSQADAIRQCTEQIFGIDIHPVAVIIARVTYLLALGELRFRGRPRFSLPVYLGDSLQWNTQRMLATLEVRIDVPDGPSLHFPWEVAKDIGLFDSVIATMLQLSGDDEPADAFQAWLARRGVDADTLRVVTDTYGRLRRLREEGKNHIWGYVARNLVRPIWLSSPDNRVHVVVGNPPWLPSRSMRPEMQAKFRDESQRLGVWTGKAAARDLSAYFFARCTELYVRTDGRIAFILPFAALSRTQFEGFRSGDFSSRTSKLKQGVGLRFGSVRFTQTWTFESVYPLFNVPSCAVFAKVAEPGPLPESVSSYRGELPRRDATLEEADRYLTVHEAAWPTSESAAVSPYRGLFRQGAPVVPRMMFLVEPAATGRLGADPSAPAVQSRRTRLEQEPWRDLDPLRGRVEAEFLRPFYIGESVAPFRPLTPPFAVIPWDERTGHLLDAEAAGGHGYPHLSGWLRRAESQWRKHSKGKGKPRLIEHIDYFGSLAVQMPPAPVRVVYTESGTLPVAAVIRDPSAVIDHSLYWFACREQEALYLAAILSSETTRSLVEHFQSRGQWGPRHFSKYVFQLPIPTFDHGSELHLNLATWAVKAEATARQLPMPAGLHFIRARQFVRQTLEAESISQEIDSLVRTLLT